MNIQDQLGNSVSLETVAKRIVSLVPSQTELLHHFGLDDEVIGITKFCIHPDTWFKTKIRVGGTKNVNIQKVKDLRPDLIVANKEENTKADIEALLEIAPVYISDINNPTQALKMIKDLGLLCGKEQIAVDLIDDIQDDLNAFPTFSGTVLYFIWNDPYMVCGSENYIHSIIEQLGFENVVKESRYVTLSKEEIAELNPDYIFLSTEPYPFEEKHRKEIQAWSDAKVVIVDGEMFSWYGSRMLKMRKYFSRLIL